MATWGRNAPAGEFASGQRRYGFWSILLALVALGLVIASMALLITLQNGGSAELSNAAAIAAALVYFVAAPLLHAVGFGFGVVGLTRSSSGKASSVIGILLNLILFGAGLGLVYFAGSSLTAFR